MADQRFNLSGLTEAIEEVAGPDGERLPIVFLMPDGSIARWTRLSVQMVPSSIEPSITPPHRALVIEPRPD